MADETLNGHWAYGGRIYGPGDEEKLTDEARSALKEKGAFDRSEADGPTALERAEAAAVANAETQSAGRQASASSGQRSSRGGE